MAARRPPTLAELSDAATSGANAAALRVDSGVAIQRYLGGCEALEKQAQRAWQEGGTKVKAKGALHDADLEAAFVALVKLCKLLIELLPTQHRDYNKLDAESKKQMRRQGQRALDRLGQLKLRVVDRFEAWRAEHPDEEVETGKFTPATKTTSASIPRAAPPVAPPNGRAAGPSHPASQTTIDYVKPARPSTGFDVRDIMGHASAALSSGSGASGSAPRQTSRPSSSSSQQQYAFTSSPLQPFTHSHGKLNEMPRSSRGNSNLGFGVSYPTLRPASSIRMNKHQVSQGFAPRSEQTLRYYQIDGASQTPGPSSSATGTAYPTPRLSARPQYDGQAYDGLPEHLSSAVNIRHDREQTVAAQAQSLLARQAASHHAKTEGGEPLRSLVIPGALVSRFVEIAASNTARNVETCGLLMGQILDANGRPDTTGTSPSGLLVVSTLLIPKQSATSDRCDTEDEEGIWAFMDSRQLVTLGWIHTHPRQSCFMSSLDLHTHASYQATLPEAIAIVCAPNDEPSFGLFRLTAPFGLQTILHCKEPGLFHPHVTSSGETIQAIYTDAINGHVLMTDASLHVTDLR